MIIYGSRSSHLKTIQLDNETCPHCGQQGSIILSTYARYAHIFWIPFFSLGRYSVSQCQHCKHTMEQKQMPAQIHAHHHRNLAQTRLPLWQFTGLALFAFAIVAGIYTDKADKEQQALYIQTPLAGDVYEMKTESGAYTTFKVIMVKSDSVQVRLNNYEVNTLSGIKNIDKAENYSDSMYIMPVGSLSEMFTAGEIVDVNRH